MNKRMCDICGRKQDEHHKICFNSKTQQYLCQKHKTQITRYGKVTDASQRTTADKNEYIIKDDCAEMIIRNNRQEIKAIVLIDTQDVNKCKNIKWTTDGTSYVSGDQKRYKLHRYILNYNGPLQIDHINRNKFDNRRSNLRIVTQFENAQNNGKDGVSFDRNINKWKAEFQRYGKYYYVGAFYTRENAIKELKKAIDKIDKNKEKLIKEYKEKDDNHVAGVHPSSHGKWVAKYCTNGKTFHVGTYSTKEEAINARIKYIEDFNKHKIIASA